MAKASPGDPQLDEDFKAGLEELVSLYRRNLGVPTIDWALRYLEKERESVDKKGWKSKNSKRARSAFPNISDDVAGQIAELVGPGQSGSNAA
jgi:hypothetical protein